MHNSNSNIYPPLTACWAKTNRQSNQTSLSILDHSFNVGAVGQFVYQQLTPSLKDSFPKGGITLCAIHDIGKITLGFLKKCSSWPYFPNESLAGLEGNHSCISQFFHKQITVDKYSKKWGISLGGHHGRYNGNLRPVEAEAEWANSIRAELVTTLTTVFGDISQATESKPSDYLIHWFTGFITFCDWIGSNEIFFPTCDEQPLQDRTSLAEARDRAISALSQINWNHFTIKPDRNFGDLFSYPSPNSLQKTAIDCATESGLYILEATMGLGKTEAALAIAYQRWASGEERGAYFALPTQLTSNAIHQRVSPFIENALSSITPLTLAHGNAWLSQERVTHVNHSHTTSTHGSDEASKWFASGRTALLAPFGVGTIDQALMSVLSVRFASLRFFALAGKTIILDEVHSYDPYTFHLICKLTKELIKMGSTVIVLSATLTEKARIDLVTAAGGAIKSTSNAYPLVTKVASTSQVTSTYEIDTNNKDQTFQLSHIFVENDDSPLPADLKDSILEATDRGARVLIIRNTVQKAQQCYQEVKSLVNDSIEVGLLHSRFTQSQRGEIESNWIEKLGKCQEGQPSKRPEGCVLISTQIVEQSVDIDADMMITDIAPTELILQRLGRLHRHRRPRPKGFETPLCHIIHNQVSEESSPHILKQQLGSSAYIYPPFTLLKSSELWRIKGAEKICLPRDIRDFIEETSLAKPQTIAEELLFEFQEAESTKKVNTAKTVTKKPLKPIATSDNEEQANTRWNSTATARIILLKCAPLEIGGKTILEFSNGNKIEFYPYKFDFDLAKALHENSVKLPAYLLPHASSSELLSRYFFEQATFAIEPLGVSDPLNLIDIDEPPYNLFYSSSAGLHHEKNIECDTDYHQPEEDGWW